jgi:hypothetical protein
MMRESSLIPLFRSYWNNQHVREPYLKSETENKFVLVEGEPDAKLISSIKRDDNLIPIPVSNMRFDDSKKKYVLTDDRTVKYRGKSFIIEVISSELSYCFGLVDMDHDYEQKLISYLDGKIIDSKNSITSFGKIIGKSKMKFMNDLFKELSEGAAGIKNEKYNVDRGILHIIISILGMEKFLRGGEGIPPKTKNTEIFNFEFEDLIEIALERKQYLEQKITCEDTIFIRDHDIIEVFLRYLFGKKSRGDKLSRDFVTKTFEKLILKYARLSKQTVFIENNKIFWEK